MTRRRFIDTQVLDHLLQMARAALPEQRAQFEVQVAMIADMLPDTRRMREAGALLDAIARGKLYRAAGHATFDAFLRASFGISRTTAHRLRTVARAPEVAPKRGKMVAYESARRESAKLAARAARRRTKR